MCNSHKKYPQYQSKNTISSFLYIKLQIIYYTHFIFLLWDSMHGLYRKRFISLEKIAAGHGLLSLSSSIYAPSIIM